MFSVNFRSILLFLGELTTQGYIMESLFATEPLNEFKTVTEEVFNHLCEKEKSSNSNNCQVIRAAKEEIKQVIVNCNFDLDEVKAMIETKSWDQNKVDHFISILQERRIVLLYALLTRGNSSHGDSLINFDWVLKLVLGSSELKSLKYPLVQLILHTETCRGKNQKNYELNKEALNKVIHVLESIE